jgi:steroid 5-alpha reductase family enzyme
VIRAYALVAPLTFIHAVAWFFTAILRKRNDVADVAWGFGFLFAAAAAFFQAGAAVDRGLLVVVLTALWAMRLAFHIHARNRGVREDYRYEAWRREWGKYFVVRTFLQVFVLQWLLMLVVALPVLAVCARRGGGATLWDFAGTALWAIGFYFEAAGDAQLTAFSRDPKNRGHLLTTGLWSLTRHPNYFGEVAQWWGLALIALSVPGGGVGLIGAGAITFLILKVSGIPLLEARQAQKPGWAEYAASTPAFIPRPAWRSRGSRFAGN